MSCKHGWSLGKSLEKADYQQKTRKDSHLWRSVPAQRCGRVIPQVPMRGVSIHLYLEQRGFAGERDWVRATGIRRGGRLHIIAAFLRERRVVKLGLIDLVPCNFFARVAGDLAHYCHHGAASHVMAAIDRLGGADPGE